MANLLENVELSWCFLDPKNPQLNFEKKQWSATANVNKETAMEFKSKGLIRALRPVEDANGNETGQYKLTFKANAVTAGGKDLKAPGVFTKDEAGLIVPLVGVTVGNGSTGAISYDTYEWTYNGNKGTSMSLKNVLVSNLIAYEADGAAGSEFGTVEKGAEFVEASPFKDDAGLDLDIDADDEF